MAVGVLNSAIFADMFGTPAMRGIFGDEAFLARCVDVEAALARAQGRLGIIPAEAGDAITRAASAFANGRCTLDLARLKKETETVGYPILPLVRQLAEWAGDYGRYIHWGATTQDIMDTAVVLQIRAGLVLLEGDLTAIRSHLAELAQRYRDTPMAGRTHLQHALPVTFGYKAAVWLSALDRHADRLRELRPRVLFAQFGGAAGTLASLGAGGESLETRAELARELALGTRRSLGTLPATGLPRLYRCWRCCSAVSARSRFDVMLMSATEFGEAAEPFVAGRGSSSTMPQKRNPISCELILAAAKVLRQQAGLVLDATGHGFRAGNGSLARRMGGGARSLRLCRRRAQPGALHARRADRR